MQDCQNRAVRAKLPNQGYQYRKAKITEPGQERTARTRQKTGHPEQDSQ